MIAPDDDLTAAEYALGTLDPAERADAEARRMAEAAFDEAVTGWEDRLSALSEAAPEVDPSPVVWTNILNRIEALGRVSRTVVDFAPRLEALRRQVVRWRVGTGIAAAMAAALALWIAVGTIRNPAQPATELVAFLQASGDAPAFVMGVNLRDDRMSVRPVAAHAPDGKAYELWIIDPQLGAPRSLGTLDAAVTSRAVPSSLPRDVLSRATYAVTVEQPGGSPTGAPTSQPVFLGHLVEAPR